VLFVNPRSGGGKAGRAALAERAREQAIDVVVLASGADLHALVAGALERGSDALGMAGGDGSMAIVAEAAAANALPFVPVPAGTRNHFASDVGVDPQDVVGALAAFRDGVERTVDIADVNGRTFLNNVSLGIYGESVQRAAYRDSKVRTVLETAREVFGPGGRPPEMRLVDQRGRKVHDPVLVLVSNNAYALGPRLGSRARPALDGGRLGIAVVYPHGRARVLSTAVWTAPSVTIDGDSVLQAGIDGEAAALTPPLRFTIRPKALRVRIAPRHAHQARRGLPANRSSCGRL